MHRKSRISYRTDWILLIMFKIVVVGWGLFRYSSSHDILIASNLLVNLICWQVMDCLYCVYDTYRRKWNIEQKKRSCLWIFTIVALVISISLVAAGEVFLQAHVNIILYGILLYYIIGFIWSVFKLD